MENTINKLLAGQLTTLEDEELLLELNSIMEGMGIATEEGEQEKRMTTGVGLNRNQQETLDLPEVPTAAILPSVPTSPIIRSSADIVGEDSVEIAAVQRRAVEAV